MMLVGCALRGQSVDAFHEMNVIHISFDVFSPCFDAFGSVLVPFLSQCQSLIDPLADDGSHLLSEFLA